MTTFVDALKARIPIIAATTDDVLNVAPVILQSIAKGEKKPSVVPFSRQSIAAPSQSPVVYFDIGGEDIKFDPGLYAQLQKNQRVLVVINPKAKSPLMFDAGEMVVPSPMMESYLLDELDEDLPPSEMPGAMELFKGLSLKAASEIIAVTRAREAGHLTLDSLRHTRHTLSPPVQGLLPIDTTIDYYHIPEELLEWMELSVKYFKSPKTPDILVPRGLMLYGAPGTGKSMAAKVLANQMEVPLYRLDVASSMSKYIGESEQRISRSLSLLDREAPCVVLFDEIEKLFKGGEDLGVSNRILSILLWWLQEHKSRVFVVMTSNALDKVPVELYRPGRIDEAIKLLGVSPDMVDIFVETVLDLFSLKSADLPKMVQAEITTAIEKSLKDYYYNPARLRSELYRIIKKNNLVTI